MTCAVQPHKKILIIDDNVAIHQDFLKIIGQPDEEDVALRQAESVLFGDGESRGTEWYEVDTASQGEEGYSKVKKAFLGGQPYSVAFVDMRMPPGWDGLETIRRIWSMDPDLQVVLCTAYSDHAWSDIQEKIDPKDRLLILKKPFDTIEVMQIANSLSEKWRLLQTSKSKMANLDDLVMRRTVELEDSKLSAWRMMEEAVRHREEAQRAYENLKSEVGERIKLEDHLREKARLLDKARDAIVVRDHNHRITFWNKSAERLYGWTAEEMVGRSPAEILYKVPGDFEAALASLLEHDEWVGELRQQTKDGRSLVVRGHWTLVRDSNGQPRSTLAIHTDITEQKELELQFLRSQRMESLGALAGGIAHDLNNVLTPITMAADFLRMRLEGETNQKVVESIACSAKRGADIVGQVLSFARGMEGQRIPVQPAFVIKEVVEICRETFPRQIEVHSEVSADLWSIQGDPTQVHQVLLNLCVNARDAMPQGGRLKVNALNIHYDPEYIAAHPSLPKGPHVLIEVEDSGTGMPQEVINKIFDPFFTTKEQGKGTGLGLSTTLTIVKSHGGLIYVDSIPGKGTHFRICFPANKAVTSSATEVPQAALPKGNGETILVVDDEAHVRQITLQTLESYGYSVILAADGAEAVNLYASQKDSIAAVLTDVMMPVMDGLATIKVLRQLNPDVRVIVASGYTTENHELQAELAHVKHFLQKPFRAHTLLHALSDVLKHRA